MKGIAILGFGNIGSGVADLIEKNKSLIEKTVGDTVEVKYLVDLRDFPDSPYADKVVHDLKPDLADPEVAVVVETMGGSHPAYEFSIAIMEAGKSVVTSNKEVVANFGTELLAKAAEQGVSYCFEASVGGGIPIIRAFKTCLLSDGVVDVCGILNGTTNYILTQMKDNGTPFADALAEAQRLGYAEPDPSADIDAIDTQRKTCILCALATGKLVNPENIHTKTLRNVSTDDILGAEKAGAVIKLIGRATVREDGKVNLSAKPTMVKKANPLATIQDVYNGIYVKTALTGDLMFYGRGAGKFPTAGAVVSDVINVLVGADHALEPWARAGEEYIAPADACVTVRYLRVAPASAGAAAAFFQTAEKLSETEFICEAEAESAFLDKANALEVEVIYDILG